MSLLKFAESDLKGVKGAKNLEWKSTSSFKKIGYLSKNRVGKKYLNPCLFQHKKNNLYLIRFVHREDKKKKITYIEPYDSEKEKLQEILGINNIRKLEAFILKNKKLLRYYF